ncbi:hypothetical protein MKW98_016744, partial [Papaver atlanticum]
LYKVTNLILVIQRWHPNYDVSLTRKTKLPLIRLSTGCLKLAKGNHARRKHLLGMKLNILRYHR